MTSYEIATFPLDKLGVARDDKSSPSHCKVLAELKQSQSSPPVIARLTKSAEAISR